MNQSWVPRLYAGGNRNVFFFPGGFLDFDKRCVFLRVFLRIFKLSWEVIPVEKIMHFATIFSEVKFSAFDYFANDLHIFGFRMFPKLQ